MNNEQALSAIEHLIGTVYVPTVKARITELTGRQRVVGPRDISTKEFDSNRIHVRADAADVITGFSFQ